MVHIGRGFGKCNDDPNCDNPFSNDSDKIVMPPGILGYPFVVTSDKLGDRTNKEITILKDDKILFTSKRIYIQNGQLHFKVTQ